MSARPSKAPVVSVEVAVIGAGISGIGAAIRLREMGITEFVVLEKAEGLGGTWRDNTYPGCACDVPSALYSYSFAQKRDWSRLFAGQREILDYVNSVARDREVMSHLRFGEDVGRAQWNEDARRWIVHTTRGTVVHARALISCTGYLHEPQMPDLPGLDAFPGTIFHSSRWNHDHNLAGDRVAVIGTGASAIQFVPRIQPNVAKLHVFQRSPQWILPKPDASIPGVGRGLLKLPLAAGAMRTLLYGGFESVGVGFRHPLLLKQLERLARLHLRSSVKDPALRTALTPDYTLGCKRILLSNDYYPAMGRENVELLPMGVSRIDGRRVIGADGSVSREVDTIILGTGFHVTDQPGSRNVHGADGRSLADVWAGSPQAYRGTTIAGFPNLFLVLGPNLAIGHNSAFIVIESQLAYAMDALRTMRRDRLSRIDVRADVQAGYNTLVQRELQHTVWNTGGCSSYYIDANGRNSTGFPWSTLEMRRLLAKFDRAAYRVEAEDGAGAQAAA